MKERVQEIKGSKVGILSGFHGFLMGHGLFF